MHVMDFLAPENVVADVRASSKAKLLNELSGRAAKALGVSVETVYAEIEKRDELGSTGIGNGVSIPHARLREVKRPFGLLARLSSPVEFESIDGQPVDIVFLLLLPALSQLDQLNALAAVARRLRDKEVLRKLRASPGPAELYQAITSEEPGAEPPRLTS